MKIYFIFYMKNWFYIFLYGIIGYLSFYVEMTKSNIIGRLKKYLSAQYELLDKEYNGAIIPYKNKL